MILLHTAPGSVTAALANASVLDAVARATSCSIADTCESRHPQMQARMKRIMKELSTGTMARASAVRIWVENGIRLSTWKEDGRKRKIGEGRRKGAKDRSGRLVEKA